MLIFLFIREFSFFDFEVVLFFNLGIGLFWGIKKGRLDVLVRVFSICFLVKVILKVKG